jgi:hypothetical protein
MQTVYDLSAPDRATVITKAVNVIGVNKPLFNWLRGYCTEHEIPTGVALSEAIQMYKTEVLRRGLAEGETAPQSYGGPAHMGGAPSYDEPTPTELTTTHDN